MWISYFGPLEDNVDAFILDCTQKQVERRECVCLFWSVLQDQVDRRQCRCLTGFKCAENNVDPHITTLKQWDQTKLSSSINLLRNNWYQCGCRFGVTNAFQDLHVLKTMWMSNRI
jgi:hypothetical protein